MLENELRGHLNSRSAGTPAEDRDLATTIDSIDNAIVDQLHLMHNLVMNLQKLKNNDENIALASVLLNESGANILNVYANIKDEFKLISGNRKEAKDNNKSKEKNILYQNLGDLLNMHHEQLRDNIEVTTQKIDKMVSDCIEAGALGAKINGSGFGGTMFALLPGNEPLLKKSIESNDAEAFILKTSNGVELY